MTVVPFIISAVTMLAGLSILNLLTNGDYEMQRGGGWRTDMLNDGQQLQLGIDDTWHYIVFLGSGYHHQPPFNKICVS